MTDEEQEPRGEEPRPPETENAPGRPGLEFIAGMVEAIFYLVPAITLFFGSAVLYRYVLKGDPVSLSEGFWPVLWFFLTVGVSLVVFWCYRLMWSYIEESPYTWLGLIAGVPGFFLVFGACTMAL